MHRYMPWAGLRQVSSSDCGGNAKAWDGENPSGLERRIRWGATSVTRVPFWRCGKGCILCAWSVICGRRGRRMERPSSVRYEDNEA